MIYQNITEYIINCRYVHFCGLQTLKSPYFHIVAVLDGELSCVSNDNFFQSNCYQWAGTRPIILTSNNCNALHLILKPEFLLDFLDNTFFFTRNDITLSPEASCLLHQAACRYAYLESCFETDNTFSKASILYEILQILTNNTSTADCSSLGQLQKITKSTLCNTILSYIKVNYSSQLNQADVAAHFTITPQYLSRIMKLYTGKTFKKYLTDFRLQKAKAYLKYTQLSLNDICERTCLPVDSYVFESISVDRKKISSDFSIFGTLMHTPVPTPELVKLSKNSAVSHTVVQDISFDLNTGKHIPSFWNRLINLGYATELKNLRIEKQLEIIQDEIQFTYGRICRITDLINWHNIDDKKLYNFTSVFSLLDVVIQKGLFPFLELGNKIFLIQTTTSNSLILDRTVDSIQYYDQLLELLPEFIRACINRYGQERFDLWKFEISYSFLESEKLQNFSFLKYIEYFQKIYGIIRSYSKRCQIGGPGFNDWNSIDTLKHYLRQFTHIQNVPDFFSAYLYSIDKITPYQYVICKDKDIIKKRLQIFKEEVSRIFPDKSIWITEFNSNLSSRNHLNDLSYQASFLIKTFLDVLDYGIEAMGYYILSDAPLRYSDSLEFLFGGWGLFSDTHIPKSSYYAFQMMSLLGSYLVKHTENYLFTKNSNGSFQLLINHYAHPNDKYLYENIKKEDVSMQTGKLFTQVRDLYFRFYFLNVPFGKYLVKTYRICSDASSLFHEWKKMDFITPARQRELDDLFHLSMMSPTLSVISVKETEPFTLECQQDKPGVYLYLIEQYQ